MPGMRLFYAERCAALQQGSSRMRFRMRNLYVGAGTACQSDQGLVSTTPSCVEVWSGKAVTGALQDAEVCAPWADGFTVLVGHNPGDLVQMS